MKQTYSKKTIAVFILLAIVGLVYGYSLYLNRPDHYAPNDPANNAIALHIGIAVAVAVIFTAVQAYRSRKHLHNIWLAPFSVRALSRLKRTFVTQRLTVSTIPRMLTSLLGLYLILWTPFRSAMQVTAALDPSVTANAWGGPTYIGATLAHWLDALLFLYGGALLLHAVMVKDTNKK